ncbi:hypothetical protein J3A83DRAFT_1010329 [Scleroderma citrinum]
MAWMLHASCVFFSFKYLGTEYPCTVVHWFDHVGDGPDEATGMWIVHPGYQAHNIKNIAVIHINTIYCTAHLIPIYSAHNINSRDIRPHNSYDTFHSFYVNKFADSKLHSSPVYGSHYPRYSPSSPNVYQSLSFSPMSSQHSPTRPSVPSCPELPHCYLTPQ